MPLKNRYNNQKRMVIEDFSLAAGLRCLPKNRVWGFEIENRTLVGGSSWLSSTARQGCGYRCDGTVVVSTVQRYYASAYGRFNTADPSSHSVHPKSPGSWNRYAYVGGDPVNLLDPRGMEQEGGGCGPDWTTDPSLSGPCCPPAGSGFVEDPSVDPACYVGGVDSGGAPAPPPSPKCWQNTGKIGATLSNLGTDIEADVSGKFSSTDLQALTSDINSDIATEMAAIGGGTTSSPYYIGGHFNFDISDSQINAFSSADAQLFSAIFAGTTSDGIRQSASTGLAAAGNYTLHSHDDNTPGDYSFHFDRFNPQDIAGLVGHGIYDVLGGHLGHPCLDPAWH